MAIPSSPYVAALIAESRQLTALSRAGSAELRAAASEQRRLLADYRESAREWWAFLVEAQARMAAPLTGG